MNRLEEILRRFFLILWICFLPFSFIRDYYDLRLPDQFEEGHYPCTALMLIILEILWVGMLLAALSLWVFTTFR